MKKLLWLIPAIFLMGCGAALAEEIPTVDLGAIEISADFSWVALENGFEMAVPADWVSFDVTEELAAGGALFVARSADASIAASLAYVSAETDGLDALAAALAPLYPSLGVLVANNIPMIAYDDLEGGYSALMAFDGQGGMYLMVFTPAAGDDARTMAAAMMTSIGPAEAAE